MILSINQPAYLPWLGYFHRINISDTFVFFDTVQFEKNSFTNRNKIKMPSGPLWLTVPVKLRDHFNKQIKDIELADQKWQKNHWMAIELNYKKTRYWDEYAPKIKPIYEKEYRTISDICYEQLILLLDLLDIKTKIIRSSELKEFESKKRQLVLDICREINAKVYVSGALGKNYLDKSEFNEADIKLYFQDYKHPVYGQRWGEFVPYMSVIDLLFNEGPNSKNIIMQNNITKKDLLTN